MVVKGYSQLAGTRIVTWSRYLAAAIGHKTGIPAVAQATILLRSEPHSLRRTIACTTATFAPNHRRPTRRGHWISPPWGDGNLVIRIERSEYF